MNPLGSGNTTPQMMANINPAMLQKTSQIMTMFRKGGDIKNIITTFKKSGMTPQLAEQALCMAFPQLKEIKQQMDAMKQSGMSQQDIFAEFAKKANVDPSQINNTYNDLMRLVN